MRPFTLSDVPIFVICLLACYVTSCQKKSAQAPENNYIARIWQVQGQVSYRKANSLIWTAANVDIDLFHRDALKTDENSSARVTFRTGNHLDIEEKSLVIIEAPRPISALHPKPAPLNAMVESGSVRSISKPGSPAMQVTTPDGQIALIKAEGTEQVPFRVRIRPGGKLEVAIVKGTAVVQTGDQQVRVTKNQVIDIQKGRMSSPTQLPSFPELLSPAVDANFHAGAKIPLKWRPIEGIHLYRVQVSDDVSFSKNITDVMVTVPEFSLSPQPGQKYVWRVSSVDAAGHEGEFGFARRFHVLTAMPPPEERLVSPPDNAGIQYTDQPKPITFQWESEANTFELVIAKRRSLTANIVYSEKTSTSTHTVTTLTQGKYFWGVFIITADGRRPLRDQVRRLVISRRLPPGVKVPKTIDWE